MKKRKHLSSKRSRRLFRRTASKTHGKNRRATPMRGGIRL
ncbi:MAG: hypothetical protein [Arizlama microvirus]|nr:MAG: hypothetical protein [Arizlama microvirus]